VIGVALVHVLLGAATFKGRVSREVALLLLAVGIGLSAVGAALALDGPALVAAWSVEAVLLAWLAARLGRARGYIAAAGFLAGAGLHTLAFDAPPDRLSEPATLTAVVAVALVTAAAAAISRLSTRSWPWYRDGAEAIALAGLAYLAPVALDGVWVVAAWVLLAVTVAFLERALLGVIGAASVPYIALAAAHTLAIEAPPESLRDGVGDLGSALLAVGLTTLGALVCALVSPEPVRRVLRITGAVGAVYLPSVAIVDLTSTGVEPGQTPQVLLSVFWSAVGLGTVVYGLVRDSRSLRLAGLALLGLAAAKVVAYDLSELDEIYRVLSFVGLGLLLLSGGFAYQRLRGAEGAQ
jgi:Predicted membrane protein (DUF2339)